MSCINPVPARAAGRARCFTGSSSSHPVLARDAEWAAVGVRERGTARILLRILPAFNGYLLCSDRCVTVIHLCRLRGVTEALLTSVSGSGFRSGNRRQSGTSGPTCVPCPLGSYKSGVGKSEKVVLLIFSLGVSVPSFPLSLFCNSNLMVAATCDCCRKL